MDKVKLLIGLLIVTLLTSGVIYIQFDRLRIRVDEDKTTFYILNENNRWTVSGREYNLLFDGPSRMNRDSNITIDIQIINESEKLINLPNGSIQTISAVNEVTITRITKYLRGPIIIDTYEFDGTTTALRNFPVSHQVNILNGKDKFYRYEVRDLEYDGETMALNGTSMEFGKNMEIEWDSGYNWARVFKSGILKVQYKILSDNETFNVRLFDPEGDFIGTFDVSGEGTGQRGVNLNSTTIMITDTVLAEVFLYNSSGSYLGQSWDTAAAGSAAPLMITSNSTTFLTIDDPDDAIYFWDRTGATLGSCALNTSNTNPAGIDMNSTTIIVADSIDDLIYGYNLDCTSLWSWALNSSNSNVNGLAMFEDSIRVVDITDDEVYKYNLDGTHGGASYDLLADGQDLPAGAGFSSDGTSLWIPDANDILIYEWVGIEVADVAPVVTIIFPTNITYTSLQTELNYTYTNTSALSACLYSLDEGVTNTTITCGNNVTGLDSTAFDNIWTVYINESNSGLWGSDVVTFTINLNITGWVKDNLGNFLGDVAVFILNQTDNGKVANVSTNASGYYTYGPVASGNYTIVGYDPANSSRDGDAEPFVEIP